MICTHPTPHSAHLVLPDVRQALHVVGQLLVAAACLQGVVCHRLQAPHSAHLFLLDVRQALHLVGQLLLVAAATRGDLPIAGILRAPPAGRAQPADGAALRAGSPESWAGSLVMRVGARRGPA